MMQLDARAGTRSTKTVRFDEPNKQSFLLIPIAEEMRERCETNTETKARKDAGGTRVEGFDDVVREEHRKQDEEDDFGERKTTRKHDLPTNE